MLIDKAPATSAIKMLDDLDGLDDDLRHLRLIQSESPQTIPLAYHPEIPFRAPQVPTGRRSPYRLWDIIIDTVNDVSVPRGYILVFCDWVISDYVSLY